MLGVEELDSLEDICKEPVCVVELLAAEFSEVTLWLVNAVACDWERRADVGDSFVFGWEDTNMLDCKEELASRDCCEREVAVDLTVDSCNAVVCGVGAIEPDIMGKPVVREATGKLCDRGIVLMNEIAGRELSCGLEMLEMLTDGDTCEV